MTVDITALTARYVRLADDERALKADLEWLQKQKQEIEPLILAYWIEHEKTLEKFEDGTTLYAHRQVWASHGGDAQRAVSALRSAGLDELVTVNSQTLSAWVRERQANGEEIPPEVGEAILITERTSLRTRRG
jgi:hypothetical protein